MALKYYNSFVRTWTAGEGPKKDAYNVGKLFCVLRLMFSFSFITSLKVMLHGTIFNNDF